jgi:hypothetical protein
MASETASSQLLGSDINTRRSSYAAAHTPEVLHEPFVELGASNGYRGKSFDTPATKQANGYPDSSSDMPTEPSSQSRR